MRTKGRRWKPQSKNSTRTTATNAEKSSTEPLLDTTLNTMEEKYYRLVWYARSVNRNNKEYWQTHPEDIRKGAFAAQMRVEKSYPEEAGRICSDNGDWEHGFNSGVLGAIRLVLSLSSPNCKKRGMGLSEFPCLDT